MKKSTCVTGGLCCVALCSLLLGCGKVDGQSRGAEDRSRKAVVSGIFSWEKEYLLEEKESDIMKAMEQLKCGAVYQQIPKDADSGTVKAYLARRRRKGQDVYWLAGDSAWGTQKDARSMLAEIGKVVSWNSGVGQEKGFTGIVWDVEPYLLEEWDDDREAVMEQFVSNCKEAYQKAAEKDLLVIVCIPNFYDRFGLDGQLAELVESGCDAVAVMNYNKEDEAGQIRTETELAEKYEKGIIHIAELQKPGYHELTEENTYYNDGVGAVKESFQKLEKEFNYSRMGFAWHYMKPVLELLGKEE